MKFISQAYLVLGENTYVKEALSLKAVPRLSRLAGPFFPDICFAKRRVRFADEDSVQLAGGTAAFDGCALTEEEILPQIERKLGSWTVTTLNWR